MVAPPITLQEDYWHKFKIENDDIEFLYNHLLETETPLTNTELLGVLITHRLKAEKEKIEARRSAGGEIFLPKNKYKTGQDLIFPALSWKRGKVTGSRKGSNPDVTEFEVIAIEFDDGSTREFACGLKTHSLNDRKADEGEQSAQDVDYILKEYKTALPQKLEEALQSNEEFTRIAGYWFPRALLVDVNVGHLNIAEAILDMEGGGPLPTRKLLEMVDMPADVNNRLAEFSLNFALWKDDRFDEVGPAGEILWHLYRLEPKEVVETPPYLEYTPMEYDRSALTLEMVELEKQLDDELSPIEVDHHEEIDEVEIRLIFPHWRSGSLPLSHRLLSLFPTAYQAPRIRFMLVDGETGEKFPGWVVREKKYAIGLKEFYKKKGAIPGSLLTVRRGENPGEVIVATDSTRSRREWVRTVLVGSEKNFVLAMLKQKIETAIDDRMAIAIPEPEIIEETWKRNQDNQPPFEKTVVKTLRELSKLSTQGNVHVSELYATINLTRRCPPGPIMALLNSRPWFTYVGDLHFKIDESTQS